MSQPVALSGDQPESKKKRGVIRVRTAIFGFLIGGILTLLIVSLLVAFAPDASVGIALRRIFPFPVAIADGAFISYGELDKDRESVRRFYESQSDDLAEKGLRVDFSTPDGKSRLLLREKDILNKLVEDRIILFLAQSKGIRFSNDDVTARVEDAIREQGGSRENLESRLLHFYGWNLEEFKEKIVVPSLYRDALEASFLKERDVSAAKSNIEKADSELKNGVQFDRVAEELSEGDSKKNGGDLGWVDIDSLVPELQEVARTQEIGAVSSILESTLGFHIVTVADRKTESGKEMVRMRQIFTRKPSFPEWLADKKREAVVFVLPRRYLWDSKSGSVAFRDESMRTFEKNALQQSEGDPSLVF
ncbi:MAG: peptidylprolyl isomerase [Candidatus Moraniibacteriota bacterium]|nr:MAG: peptidylprolyl isomerase [Candidatus Moranbacteria bacterium]